MSLERQNSGQKSLKITHCCVIKGIGDRNWIFKSEKDKHIERFLLIHIFLLDMEVKAEGKADISKAELLKPKLSAWLEKIMTGVKDKHCIKADKFWLWMEVGTE